MTSAIPFRSKKEASSVPVKKAAPAKTAAKKAAAPTVAAKSRKTTPKKESVESVVNAKESIISVEQRYKMICEAAFYIAEKNGFNAENALEHWLLAEKEIDAKIFN